MELLLAMIVPSALLCRLPGEMRGGHQMWRDFKNGDGKTNQSQNRFKARFW
jgi:hypothetical protein